MNNNNMEDSLKNYEQECLKIRLPLTSKIPDTMTVKQYLANAKKVYKEQLRASKALDKYIEKNRKEFGHIIAKTVKLKEFNPDNVDTLLQQSQLTPFEKQFLLDNHSRESLSEKQMNVYNSIVDKVVS